jgi:hypothetical protein
MSLWKIKLITWKMSPVIQKSDTCNFKKLKACICNLEKTYNESCNHENYYHEILKTYTNKFDIMKWAKKYSIVFIWEFCSHIHCYYVYTEELLVHCGNNQNCFFLCDVQMDSEASLLGSKSPWTPKMNPECTSYMSPPKHVQSKSGTNVFFWQMLSLKTIIGTFLV